jgi:hypothetical protein
MISSAIERMQALCDEIPALLLTIDEAAFSHKPAPGKWSKKEIIGHLIDSAANNHHRFVRGQFDDVPRITYDQDAWNAHNYYQQMDGRHVITFWEHYNRHLLEIIRHIPEHLLSRRVETGGESFFVGDAPPGPAPTIAFLIEDYVAHMEYHLRQIVNY